MEIISAWELYLWTRLDGLNIIFKLLAIMSVIGVIIYLWASLPIYECDGGEATKKWLRHWWKIVVPAVLFVMIFVLLPTKKDMAMIYVIPKIMNNEHIRQEAGEIYTIAKEAMKEYLPQKDAD